MDTYRQTVDGLLGQNYLRIQGAQGHVKPFLNEGDYHRPPPANAYNVIGCAALWDNLHNIKSYSPAFKYTGSYPLIQHHSRRMALADALGVHFCTASLHLSCLLLVQCQRLHVKICSYEANASFRIKIYDLIRTLWIVIERQVFVYLKRCMSLCVYMTIAFGAFNSDWARGR